MKQADKGTIPSESGKEDREEPTVNVHYKKMMKMVNAPENHPEQCKKTETTCKKAPY